MVVKSYGPSTVIYLSILQLYIMGKGDSAEVLIGQSERSNER